MVQGIFQSKMSRKQSLDSGLAFTLILLLLGYFSENETFYMLAIPSLLFAMAIPWIFYPFALLWINLANAMGFVMSKVILFLVFSIIVIPMGFIRKLAGKDDLQLREWKKGSGSVFANRDHLYSPEDLKHPY